MLIEQSLHNFFAGSRYEFCLFCFAVEVLGDVAGVMFSFFNSGCGLWEVTDDI